jgi:hypothetical protein
MKNLRAPPAFRPKRAKGDQKSWQKSITRWDRNNNAHKELQPASR